VQARDLMKRTWQGKGPAAFLLGALLCCAGFPGQSARGAPPADEAAFRAAFNLFQDFQYPLAETNFSNFLAVFTNSTHRADAILYLARARLEQSNYNGAINLLEATFAGARDLTPDYVFWIAKARLKAGDYPRAAEGFSNLVKNSPHSPRALEAAYDEADACARMGRWPEVIRLLQPADGAFRLMAAEDPKGDFATMGSLLLGEALFAQTNYPDGEKVAGAIDPAGLKPEFQWRRQYLLCRIKLAAGRAEEALNESTNLLDVAFGPRHQAESVFLRGEILEKLGRPAEALPTYARNLADTLPDTFQEQALAKTVQLTVALNPTAEAIAALEGLVARRPRAPGLELARLSLGELYLKANFPPPKLAEGTNGAPLPTNSLEHALTNFTIVIRDFTNSPLVPKAHLDRGWCYWTQGKISQARADFEEAANHLPFSEDQAVARFKLADAQFSGQDYAGAVSNYNLLLAQFDKFPAVTNELFDQALYQLVEANISRGDDEAARAAAKKILEWYPGSYFGDRSSLLMGEDMNWKLLMGEDLNRKYDYDMVRTVFTDLMKRSPNSPLLPEVQYAIARTYDHQQNWPAAISGYTQWVTNYLHDPLLPEVEFSLALAYDQAGMETNALMKFTNFVARFSTNSTNLAAWAQNWVADFYYDQEDFPSAEKNYEVLFQKFGGVGDLAWQARLMAGKAALAHQAVEDARQYFSDLVKDTNAPPALASQGWFALGDTIFQQFQANPTNQTYLNDAIAALSRLTNGAPTNPIAVEALGRLGDYYGHWADIKSDPGVYAKVIELYGAIASFPASNVSVAVRSQAEVGLGVIAEKQHLPQQALEHYCKVLYGYDPNHFDPYWLDRAGEFAARLCEDQQQWDQAVRIYKRVIDAVPALRPVLEKKKNAAQSHSEAARN
jgi:tetratricopeptide (TPR) repeat protein